MPTFVDTNILVYAEDRDAGTKHAIARDLVTGLWHSGQGVLSVQVLQEFFVTVTRKMPRPLDPGKALVIVGQYLTWKVVDSTGELLLSAVRRSLDSKLSFWDSLILEAALKGRCESLLTEDLIDGQRIGGLTIVNPFLAQRSPVG